MNHIVYRSSFFLLLLWSLVIFRSFQSLSSPWRRAFPDTVLSDSFDFVMHNVFILACCIIFSSKAESNERFQVLQVSSTEAKAPLTLISVSLLFCFLVVSFAVCHTVALPWFMSCLCFVSVSIPLHLKCPATPPVSSLGQIFNSLLFFPHSSALNATCLKPYSLISTTVSGFERKLS